MSSAGTVISMHAVPNVKAQPHGGMRYTHDGTFQNPSNAAKKHALLCDVNSNMFNILLLILEYLGSLFFNFETAFSKMMAIS